LDRLDQLVAIDAAATQAREARTAAIFAAYDDGVPNTTIAGRLGVTHEAIRKMLRAAGH
jgi:DNA-binding transcriptional regulator LsrR (DeoR family)